MFEDMSAPRAARLAPQRRDMLYAHQLASPSFYVLDERSLLVAGVVDSQRLSKRAFLTMQKHGIITAEGKLDTEKVGPKFIHQFSFIDVYRQKELVNMLFWWQEECQRYGKLVDEDRELEVLVKEAEERVREDGDDVQMKEGLDQVRFAREWVRMKIRQGPSQRRVQTEESGADAMETARRTMSAPLLGQLGAAAKGRDEALPSYR